MLYSTTNSKQLHSTALNNWLLPSNILLGPSGGLRNVRTVRSHKPPLKQKAPLKKNHRVNCEKNFFIWTWTISIKLFLVRKCLFNPEFGSPALIFKLWKPFSCYQTKSFASEEPENSWVRECSWWTVFRSWFWVSWRTVPLLRNWNYGNWKLCPNMAKFPITELWKSWLRNRFSVKKKLPLSYSQLQKATFSVNTQVPPKKESTHKLQKKNTLFFANLNHIGLHH